MTRKIIKQLDETKCPLCNKTVRPIVNSDYYIVCPECGYVFSNYYEINIEKETKLKQQINKNVLGNINARIIILREIIIRIAKKVIENERIIPQEFKDIVFDEFVNQLDNKFVVNICYNIYKVCKIKLLNNDITDYAKIVEIIDKYGYEVIRSYVKKLYFEMFEHELYRKYSFDDLLSRYFEEFEIEIRTKHQEFIPFLDEFREWFFNNIIKLILMKFNYNKFRKVCGLNMRSWIRGILIRAKYNIVKNIFVTWLHVKKNFTLYELRNKYKLINGYGAIYKWKSFVEKL